MTEIQKPDHFDYEIAALAALAVSIHIAESAVPMLVPGIKPGLSNVITLIVLMRLGWRAALWVSALKVLVGSIAIGTFLSPTFILSVAGAICGTSLLIGTYQLTRMWDHWQLSEVGLSVLASCAHMLGQFYVAHWLFIPHEGIFYILPVLMTAAFLFGMVSGLVARYTLKFLAESTLTKHRSQL